MDDSVRSFKEKLDIEHRWPSPYTFKFISPREKLDDLKALFPGQTFKEKLSRKGNYTGITFEMQASSSDEVVAVYEKVHSLGGIISL